MANLSKFAALTLIALLAAAITACGGNGASEPATTAAPATATPAPTPRPTDTIAPTATPRPTNTPAPQSTATAAPAATPQPTATSAPTATPQPTATAAPTATPQPTATAAPIVTPQPTATPAPIVTPQPLGEPIADALSPIGDNLQWAAHYDNATGQISVHDPSGSFSIESLALPPGLSVNDSDTLPALTHLVHKEIYFVSLSRAQQVVLRNEIRNLSAGVNFLTW